MKRYLKIRPKNGSKVRVPYKHRHLFEQGETVANTVYWRRQLEAGKVELVMPEKPKARKALKVEEAE